MEYTFQRRMEKLEALKEKYPALEIIMDINKIIQRIIVMLPSNDNDNYHKKNFKELELKLKQFHNTLYGISTKQNEQLSHEHKFLLDEISKEPILKAEPNKLAMSNAFKPTHTIYTNRTTTGKTAIKTGLSKIDAETICDTCNGIIEVPPNQSLTEMIGYMWYVPE